MKKLFTFFGYLMLTVSISAQISTNGLVAYYPFNGNANDSCGYNGSHHNGTVSNAALTTDRDGVPNRAYGFNGLNSYINLGVNMGINSLQYDFTIAYWIYRTTSTSGGIIASFSTQDDSNWRFLVNTGTSNIGVQFVPGWQGREWQSNSTPLNTILLNTWHHVIHVRKGNKLSTYIDNVLISTSTVSSEIISNPTTPHATTKIGYLFPSCPECRYFAGKLDDIEFYNRALMSDEIITSNNKVQEVKQVVVSPNPVRDYKMYLTGFEGKATMTLYNISGVNMLTINIRENENENVNLDMLPKGLYLIKLSTQNGNLVRKIEII